MLIRERLKQCRNFKDFFVEVSKMKVIYDIDDLKKLQKIIKEFVPVYGSEAIVYLSDCISTERVLPCKSEEARHFREKQMQKEISDNFSSIFPEFEFVQTEKSISGIGRIDILAKKGEQPVIIELKAGRQNPNKQLIAYASKFKNPVLIGITEEPLPKDSILQEIQYYLFSDLKEGAETWIL